ncbi:MAG: large subunit ribosomal protein L18 [Planctomycetota bacterium]|jgi:large subunit ribosomal protein L18
MKTSQIKNRRKTRRKMSVRRRVRVSGPNHRLAVNRTSKHIYAQVVDDETGQTLCGVGSTAKALAGDLGGKPKTERAAVVGREIARLAKEKGVERVRFDRGGSRYHGRVKSLADAAREGGLTF